MPDKYTYHKGACHIDCKPMGSDYCDRCGWTDPTQHGSKCLAANKRLKYLKDQIHNECISYGEIAELQSLKAYIDPSDVELLQWAGVPEGGAL